MIKLTEETLQNNGTNFQYRNLSTVQRILLGSDGTMTNMLEELLREELRANKLFEEIASSETDIPQLALAQGEYLWRRTITLQGKFSGINFLYAESMIAPNNLDYEFAEKLISSDTPIGKIWELFRVETYKSLISWGVESAGEVARHFEISPEQLLLYRTYRVFSQRRPVMQRIEQPDQQVGRQEHGGRHRSPVAEHARPGRGKVRPAAAVDGEGRDRKHEQPDENVARQQKEHVSRSARADPRGCRTGRSARGRRCRGPSR